MDSGVLPPEDAGCGDCPWFETQQLDLEGAAVALGFGAQVAMSPEGVLVVGAPGSEVLGTAGFGAVFELQDGVWNQEALIEPLDETLSRLLGNAVAIDKDLAAVGIPGATLAGGASGAVSLVEREGARWVQGERLFSSDIEAGDGVGGAVDVFGDQIAVGAANEDTGGEDTGTVYLFGRAGAITIEIGPLRVADTNPFSNLGFSLAFERNPVDEGRLFVGAPKDLGGSVFVFQTEAGDLSPIDKLEAIGGEPGDRFGHAIAADSGVVVIGQPGPLDVPDRLAGEVAVFEQVSGQLQQTEALVASDSVPGDRFGTAVALHGDTILVGAPGALGGQGAVYVFERVGGALEEVQILTSLDSNGGERFGSALAIIDGTIAVGAPGDLEMGNSRGTVYIFEQ